MSVFLQHSLHTLHYNLRIITFKRNIFHILISCSLQIPLPNIQLLNQGFLCIDHSKVWSYIVTEKALHKNGLTMQRVGSSTSNFAKDSLQL